MKTVRVEGTQFWIAAALVIVALVLDDVQDAINHQGDRIAAACAADQAPHAERRP